MGRRTALLIATDTYDDATFRRLVAPKNDTAALGAVLANEAIGNYHVLPVLHNAPMHETLRTIQDVLADARPADQVLLYFSGHGVKTDGGELYLPCVNSPHDRLESTAVSALWIRQRLEESRSRHIMVWLDCCYAGAFPPGALHRTDESMDASAQLGGIGCVVMTSSNRVQYAYESTGKGSPAVTGTASPSVFTGILVDGLRTGNADLGGDGLIDADELYDYVHARMRETPLNQTPTQQSHVEGKLYVASSIRGPRTDDGRRALRAISYLAELARTSSPSQVENPRLLLALLAEDRNPSVAEAARRALESTARTAGPAPVLPDTVPPRSPSETAGQPGAAPVRGTGRADAVTGAPAVSAVRRILGTAEPSGLGEEEELDLAAATLAKTVQEQWIAEAGIRWGGKSEPLAVRWSTTGRPVAAPPTAVLGTVIPGRPLRMRLHGDFQQMADKFRQLPMRQLVILGSPGSGKTALATRMLLGLLEDAQPDDPVPVLLPVSSWNPHEEQAYEWMARRLTEAYPVLTDMRTFGDKAAFRLLTAHRVLPVLDGLDEMPASWQHLAIQALDQTVGGHGPLVLTCRSAEYEAAVSASGSLLSHAAVVELETPNVVDIIGFLQANHSPADRLRWKPVCDHLRLHPDGRLAQALSTPLMIDLTTAAYADPATKPAELIDDDRFSDHAAIQQHLLDAFITTRLSHWSPHSRSGARERRWLVFISQHLNRLGTRELEWWKLSQAVPRWLIRTLVSAVPIVLIVAPLSAALAIWAHATFTDQSAVWGIGVAMATVLGQRAGHVVRSPRKQVARDLPRSVLRGVVTDLGAAIGTVSITFTALLVIAYFASRPDAIGFSYSVIRWIRQLPNGGRLLDFAMSADMGLTLIVLTNLLAASHGGMPQRGVPRIRRLVSSLGIGALAGLVVTSPATVYGVLQSYDNGWLRAGLIVALLVGVVVGLGRWLATPVDERAAGSPLSVLRSDRRTLLISAAATMAVTSLIGSGVFGIATHEWTPSILTSLIAGLVMAIVMVLGSGSAWLSYSITRLWLALRGKLPWRLMSFLREAHSSGVVRQVGPAYQLSHALLQDRLARSQPSSRTGHEKETPQRQPRRPLIGYSGNFWRRLAFLPVVPLAALVCAVAAIQVTTPRPLAIIHTGTAASSIALSADSHEIAIVSEEGEPEVWNIRTGHLTELHGPDSSTEQFNDSQALAFSSDGRTLVDAWTSEAGTQVARWNTTTGNEIGAAKDFSIPGDPAVQYETVALSANGDLLWILAGQSGKSACKMEQWSITRTSGRRAAKNGLTYIPGASPGFGMAISSNISLPTLAIFNGNSKIDTWKLDPSGSTSELYHPIPIKNAAYLSSVAGAPYQPIALNPAGAVLATLDESGHVQAWDLHSGRPIGNLVPPVESFDSIAFSSGGRTLAVSGANDVEIWPAAPG